MTKLNRDPLKLNKTIKALVSPKLPLIMVLTVLLSACGDSTPTVSSGVLTTATQGTIARSPTPPLTTIPMPATAIAISTPTLAATPTTDQATTVALSAATPTSIPDALVKQFAGKYTTTITKEDLDKYPVKNYRNDLEDNIGSWVEEYSASGTLTLIQDGQTLGEAKYILTQDQLTITDSICRQHFGVEAQTGTYHWQLNGKTLILTPIQDKCAIRKFAQTARPWTKS